MSGKESKPWSFGLFGGKGGSKSIVIFFVLLVVAVLINVAGAIKGELSDRRERPVLALKSALRDVREFIKTEKRIPGNYRELEVKVWNKGKPDEPTRLNGNNIFVSGFYEYIYFSGEAQEIGIVSIWAVPLGKYRDEYDTVLLIIKPDGETTWRGPALTQSQTDFVISKGFDMNFQQMASLNMKKDADEPAAKKRFGFF